MENFPREPVARGGIHYPVSTNFAPPSPSRRGRIHFRARMLGLSVRRWIHDRTAD